MLRVRCDHCGRLYEENRADCSTCGAPYPEKPERTPDARESFYGNVLGYALPSYGLPFPVYSGLSSVLCADHQWYTTTGDETIEHAVAAGSLPPEALPPEQRLTREASPSLIWPEPEPSLAARLWHFFGRR